MGHVWTAPAVKRNRRFSDAFGCGHVFGLFAAALAAGHDAIRGSVPSRAARSFLAWHMAGFPDRTGRPFRITSSSPLQFMNARTEPHPSIARLLTPLPQAQAPESAAMGQQRPGHASHLVGKCHRHDLEGPPRQELREPQMSGYQTGLGRCPGIGCAAGTRNRRGDLG